MKNQTNEAAQIENSLTLIKLQPEWVTKANNELSEDAKITNRGQVREFSNTLTTMTTAAEVYHTDKTSTLGDMNQFNLNNQKSTDVAMTRSPDDFEVYAVRPDVTTERSPDDFKVYANSPDVAMTRTVAYMKQTCVATERSPNVFEVYAGEVYTRLNDN